MEGNMLGRSLDPFAYGSQFVLEYVGHHPLHVLCWLGAVLEDIVG